MNTIEIFCSYAPEDNEILSQLKKQLAPLLRYQSIRMDLWYDAHVLPGEEWGHEVHKHLNNARIILLLVSPDFMSSDRCHDIEMKRAMERHERGEAHVIPIIVRPVHWQLAPFGTLRALPKDAKPVVSWSERDEALFDVAEGINNVIESLCHKPMREQPPTALRLTGTSVPSLCTIPWNWEQYTVSQTLVHHLGSIASSTLSSDETVLISDSWDQAISYGNVRSNQAQVARTLAQLSGQTYTVAFNPGESFLAGGGDDGIVRIWNPYTGDELKTLRGHTSPVSCVTFSPDGRMLASASDDHTIRLWNPYTGDELKTLRGHTSPVSCVTFSPDGRMLASAGYDHTIRLWNPLQGYLLATLTHHRETVHCVAFHCSPVLPPRTSQQEVDWDLKLVSGDHQGYIFIYKTSNRSTEALASGANSVRPLPPGKWDVEQVLQQPGPVYSIASHRPSGTLISGAHDGIVRVWDPRTRQILKTFTEHKKAVSCVAVSRGGNIIVSGSLDKTIQVRRLQDKSRIPSFSVLYPSSERCPVCQETVSLADCARISTRTLKIVRVAPKAMLKRRALMKEFTVDRYIRALCPNCSYAFPPNKAYRRVPLLSSFTAFGWFILSIHLIIFITALLLIHFIPSIGWPILIIYIIILITVMLLIYYMRDT